MQNLTILGSTGSVGVNTLEVVALHPGKFRVVALTARHQLELLFAQCLKFKPLYAVVLEPQSAELFAKKIRKTGLECEVLCGVEALEEVASLPDVDVVMAAIVGIAGLRPTLAAARAGKKLVLANQAPLVTAGGIFMDAVRANGATLLPIDSEHNAIFQTLPHDYAGDLRASGVRRILLTASGGPFRTTPLHLLETVTPAQACAHPNWVMGKKISVDSATMMNKGLEVIEAHWLFNATPAQIEVVIHPESVIHSLVEYVDGSVIAQLGNPDMRTPIANALGYPERLEAGVDFLELATVGALHFERPDEKRFPCLRLAYAALRAGGAAPTVLNAANEVAVESFLAGALSFAQIPALLEFVLSETESIPMNSLEDVLSMDQTARLHAGGWLEKYRVGTVGNLRKNAV
jgi:1-deoxy-D-xylulose-5-phosphate reductoisomerase